MAYRDSPGICYHKQSADGAMKLSMALQCREFYQEAVLMSLLDANKQLDAQYGSQLLTCPAGYLVAGYQARTYEGGISFFDVCPAAQNLQGMLSDRPATLGLHASLCAHAASAKDSKPCLDDQASCVRQCSWAVDVTHGGHEPCHFLTCFCWLETACLWLPKAVPVE